jgi:rhodanese-related sulfurtransferase
MAETINNRGELIMAKVKTISTEQLQQRLKQGDSLHFWNVLSDGYFKGEMIPGSRRVPLDTIGREGSETQSAKGEEIIVYCGGPTCPQSLQAAQKLTDLGYSNVRAYEGGLEEWKNAGNKIERVEQASAA